MKSYSNKTQSERCQNKKELDFYVMIAKTRAQRRERITVIWSINVRNLRSFREKHFV